MRLYPVLYSLCLASSLAATEVNPWLTDVYEFEPKVAYSYAPYPRVQSPNGDLHYSSNDNFLDLSLGLTVAPQWYTEVELQFLDTRAESARLEYGRVSGRYLLLDDVGGDDPVSCVVGLIATFPLRGALHDLSVQHHGYTEGELYLSVGKEFPTIPFCPYWQGRAWGLVGLGSATEGSPWLHSIFAYEHNFCDRHQFQLAMHTLAGFGSQNLVSVALFNGYGPIHHQAIDLELTYRLLIPFTGTFTIGYTRRCWARNCPIDLNAFTLTFTYPFSL